MRREARSSQATATSECVDLRDFGRTYRVFTSEDHVEGSLRDPWNLELRGIHGKVWPYGGDLLLAYTHGHKVRYRLAPLGVVQNWGDEEAVVRFTPDRLPEVAEVLRLRKRRVMSPAARAAAAERMRLARPS